MLKISIFTEVGNGYGYGHLTRCTAISDAFFAYGFEASIFVRGEGGVDWEEDISFFESRIANSDIVIIDSYKASLTVYEKASLAAKVCVWLDDFNRLNYPTGIVHNASKTPLLRREFWYANKKSINSEVKNVFVNLGSANTYFDFIAAVKSSLGESVRVVTIGNSSAAEVKQSMEKSDLAVSAAGQTLLELAALGVPTIAIITADNQLQNAKLLFEAGFCSVLYANNLTDLNSAIADFAQAEKRTRASLAGQGFYKKIGALELASNVLFALGIGMAKNVNCVDGILNKDGLTLKPFWSMSKDESGRVLSWRNRDEVRRWMFSKEPIDKDVHESFIESLKSDRKKLYWLVDNIGVVSLVIDYENEKAQIGIYKAPDAGKGSGAKMLTALIDIAFSKIGIRVLEAEVYTDNESAIKLYNRFGFCFIREYSDKYGTIAVYELKRSGEIV